MGMLGKTTRSLLDRGDKYAAKKETERRRNAAASAADRDIAAGYPGEPKNPQRRAACRDDLERYLRTYYPRVFRAPFSRGHKKLIAKAEECERQGGLYSLMFFRGGGKTSIFEHSAIHATSYGFRRFVVTVSATARDAREIMKDQKKQLWSNELLLADFPEICYPFACLKNDGRLSRRQIWNGQPTHIVWSPDQVVFPWIPPSQVGGSVLVARAITGAIKGLHHVLPDGTTIRPDFVQLDDTQTRGSAKSLTQTETRMQTIDGDILGLAGHEVPITVLQAITPIYDGDLACIYGSRELKPEWQADTVPMLVTFPDALDTLWEQYRQIQTDALKNDGDKQAATRFYVEHQFPMDAGAVLTWPEGPTSGRASVLQYAMDLYFRSRPAFFAEFQCRPLTTAVAPGLMLTADAIAKKTSGLSAGQVPPEADYLTAFIDMGKAYLFYVVCAWRKDFTGSVIEYGAFPQQRRRYYTKDDANPTIASHFAAHRPALAGANEATMLAAALDTFLPELRARTWTNANGDEFRLKRVLCDTGDLGDVVCAAIARLSQPREKLPVIMPSFGVGIGPTKKPMSQWTRKDGDLVGWHWRAPEPKDRKALREVQIDTNHYKSLVHKSFMVDHLLPGSLTLFGDKRTDHQLFSDHLTAERPKELQNKSDDRTVVVWDQIPGRENEGLDGVVGCAAAAATLGAELSGAQEPAKRTGRQRRPIGELIKGPTS